MRSFKNIDTLQVIGLFLSVAIAILTWVMTGAKDPIPSITLGFVLAILTQGLDLQKRLNEDELQVHVGRKLDFLNAFQIKEALVELQRLIPVPLIVVHSMYWALAYGENAERVLKALKGGVTMATTRFCCGDDFTVESYKDIERLPPNPDGVVFANELKKLLGDRICCVPVVHAEGPSATTVGLGDAFVGGFLPALLS